MVVLDFSLFPLGKGESLSPYVARSLDIIDRSGVDYRCHAMGTTLEGDFDTVLAVVKQCFEAMTADCDRDRMLDQDRLSQGLYRPARWQNGQCRAEAGPAA